MFLKIGQNWKLPRRFWNNSVIQPLAGEVMLLLIIIFLIDSRYFWEWLGGTNMWRKLIIKILIWHQKLLKNISEKLKLCTHEYKLSVCRKSLAKWLDFTFKISIAFLQAISSTTLHIFKHFIPGRQQSGRQLILTL